MTSETRARTIIRAQTTKTLIEQFIMTDHVDDENIPRVRGWLMDELEARDQEAFDAWLDQEDPTSESLRRFFA